jgi:hypothetical protein
VLPWASVARLLDSFIAQGPTPTKQGVWAQA